MNKKAYFFSLDAFIALLIILGVVFFIKPSSVQISQDMNLQEDLLMVLSSLKIGEINNSYVQQLISEGNITNLNQSILEQIGEFYSSSNPEAEILAEEILGDLDLDQNIGLYFNGMTIAIVGNLGIENSERIWTSRQIISGIQKGNSSKGYSSRAFLFSENKVKYFYFGGYVGDGNITLDLGEDVLSADMEAVFSGDFDLYINEVFVNSYTPSLDIPYKINLALGNFSSGNNEISFVSNSSLYIAGGYVKVVYNSSEVFNGGSKKIFPGIEGIINIYDSFYIPGILNELEIFLHYNSSYNIFLNIGDKNVYSGNSSGEEATVTLTDSTLSSILNYSELDDETIPIRLGIENVSYLTNFTVDVDVFSVTDLSGSMAPGCSGADFWCCLFSGDFCSSQTTCNSCSGTWEDKLTLAKDANRVFIDAVLNSSGNKVGLVGYANDAPDSDYHQLSNDNVSLKNKIDSWTASGATCICCGINKASNKTLEESTSGNLQSMVVMSDGGANVECSEQGTGDAKQDAIQAACDSYNNYNITVHTVGFGEDADQVTLQLMADCGGGSYYYGDVAELTDLYEQIAEDILEASYSEQTVVGGEGLYSKLYPDSYISFDYEREIPYGLIITAETPDFGNNISEGSFNVPNDTIPHEIRVVSYSGSQWTDNVEVYNNSSGVWDNVFNLSTYNTTYTNLGDPYVVHIPLNKIIYGDNLIRVSTGLNSVNSSGGSIYDKIIYSLIKNISSYSPIVSSAEGCMWHIEFEDETNSTINIPSGYSGSKECYFTSDNLAYNNNDAIDNAIFYLLSSLDLNSNRKIETKFSENDLTIDSLEVEGIPFTWETEVQVRVWR